MFSIAMSSSIHLNASNPAKCIESHISGGPFDLGLSFQLSILDCTNLELGPPAIRINLNKERPDLRPCKW
jgi:hypothetical protein